MENTSGVPLGLFGGHFDDEHDPHGMDEVNYMDAAMNMSGIPYPPIIPKPTWEILLKSLFSALIIIAAILGNTLVIYIVWRNKRMRTTTNYFLVNLAVSDLMVTLSCTWVHLVDDLTEGWVLGAFFCKFNSFAQVLSLVSSIMTLTLISCDRFFGIVFAMKAHMTERRSPIFIMIVWILAVGISSPLLVYREQRSRHWLNHTEIWCDDTWPEKTTFGPEGAIKTFPSRTAYYTFISLVLYFFPILVMSIAYSFIIWKLWSSHMPGERIESEVRSQDRIKKRVIIMLVIILSVFALCWLPFQIAILYNEHRSNKTISLPLWYGNFNYFANYIAYANSAFNPVIYTGFNENFKRGFKSLFGCKKPAKKYNAISGMTRDTSFGNLQSVTATGATKVTEHTRVKNLINDK
uniref:Orphan G-protein coupled receptor 59 n=1 Tax=Platynereis dumerilii TaxID=6359 RepID=A0A0K0PUK6_PLADU|nr:orphan G-protein coupled receptor 59 [Platynereis dumerilii]